MLVVHTRRTWHDRNLAVVHMWKASTKHQFAQGSGEKAEFLAPSILPSKRSIMSARQRWLRTAVVSGSSPSLTGPTGPTACARPDGTDGPPGLTRLTAWITVTLPPARLFFTPSITQRIATKKGGKVRLVKHLRLPNISFTTSRLHINGFRRYWVHILNCMHSQAQYMKKRKYVSKDFYRYVICHDTDL